MRDLDFYIKSYKSRLEQRTGGSTDKKGRYLSKPPIRAVLGIRMVDLGKVSPELKRYLNGELSAEHLVKTLLEACEKKPEDDGEIKDNRCTFNEAVDYINKHYEGAGDYMRDNRDILPEEGTMERISDWINNSLIWTDHDAYDFGAMCRRFSTADTPPDGSDLNLRVAAIAQLITPEELKEFAEDIVDEYGD